ncbi:hypothetical protein F5148DRAFT_1164193 [Russula earlei]|uniref:Uncharacterized protein n=1 Tax=Russula earlei TaxID=71964 RepID=A0ACC0UL15_9AGAM|nr:hypothetical protein F5148DRAFT_1164193 [Russula earlei]
MQSPPIECPRPGPPPVQDGEDEMNNLEQLIDVGTKILNQALDLLNETLTSDDQLTVPSQYMPGSTIGKHLRHARDHFSLLLDCVSRPCPYVLSYDVRSRNTPMETSREVARDAIENTIEQLKQIVTGVPLDAPITLHAITPYSQTMQTTFGRELWFAGLHAVHHWSMIRVIAGEQVI